MIIHFDSCFFFTYASNNSCVSSSVHSIPVSTKPPRNSSIDNCLFPSSSMRRKALLFAERHTFKKTIYSQTKFGHIYRPSPKIPEAPRAKHSSRIFSMGLLCLPSSRARRLLFINTDSPRLIELVGRCDICAEISILVLKILLCLNV